MSRREKMRVPAAMTADEREAYSSPGGRALLHTLARYCSPRTAAVLGPVFAEEVQRLRDERDAAIADLIRATSTRETAAPDDAPPLNPAGLIPPVPAHTVEENTP